jgi:hypothetical protein
MASQPETVSAFFLALLGLALHANQRLLAGM